HRVAGEAVTLRREAARGRPPAATSPARGADRRAGRRRHRRQRAAGHVAAVRPRTAGTDPGPRPGAAGGRPVNSDLRNALITALLATAASASGFYADEVLPTWFGGFLFGLSLAWVAVWATTRKEDDQ